MITAYILENSGAIALVVGIRPTLLGDLDPGKPSQRPALRSLLVDLRIIRL